MPLPCSGHFQNKYRKQNISCSVSFATKARNVTQAAAYTYLPAQPASQRLWEDSTRGQRQRLSRGPGAVGRDSFCHSDMSIASCCGCGQGRGRWWGVFLGAGRSWELCHWKLRLSSSDPSPQQGTPAPQCHFEIPAHPSSCSSVD